ncbi:hypothetical protein SPE26_32100 [Bacillus thuringiensis]|uniref:hypothetical protein n=1 Tax=Bacillus thuringiensis TaxID=1428 RepID=UPI002A6B33DA|nr:hypothetical protein [Bacillus thuringiensis]MDY4395262.1 hypothetical protein [Bacillus thuringiensis]
MALDVSKCGKKTVHLQAKGTLEHYVRLMTCNKLECPRCQPVLAARIKKRVRWNAQHNRLFFFNTITSKDGFEDLEKIFKKIRKELTYDFVIETYMKKKKVDYDKALVWYEKKKLIESDLDIELRIMARMDAIMKVATSKRVYYKKMSSDKQREFKLYYAGGCCKTKINTQCYESEKLVEHAIDSDFAHTNVAVLALYL